MIYFQLQKDVKHSYEIVMSVIKATDLNIYELYNTHVNTQFTEIQELSQEMFLHDIFIHVNKHSVDN